MSAPIKDCAQQSLSIASKEALCSDWTLLVSLDAIKSGQDSSFALKSCLAQMGVSPDD